MNKIAKCQTVEVLNPTSELPLTPIEIEHVVKNFPENAYGCFYNKMFDDQNFVFILNGEWKFWKNDVEIIEDWSWEDDVEEIIQSYIDEGDSDYVEEFCNGWEYSDNQGFEYNLENKIKFLKTEPIYVNIKSLLSEIQNIEEQALTILREKNVSDEDKVRKILALR